MLDPSSEGIILVYVTLEMLDETPRNRAQKPSKEVSNSCDVFIPTLPTPPPIILVTDIDGHETFVICFFKLCF